MKIYVAGKTQDVEKVRTIMRIVKRLGHEITHDWTVKLDQAMLDRQRVEMTETGRELQEREMAIADREGVRDADVLLIVSSEHALVGALIEAGMALGLGKQVIMVKAPMESFPSSVFWHLPEILLATTNEDSIAWALSCVDRDLIAAPAYVPGAWYFACVEAHANCADKLGRLRAVLED